MKKKIINVFLMALLAMVTVGTVVSCKDYEEDNYSDLNGKFTNLSGQLQDQIDALEKFKGELEAELTELKNGYQEGDKVLGDRITIIEEVLIPGLDQKIIDLEKKHDEDIDDLWLAITGENGINEAIADLSKTVSGNTKAIEDLQKLIDKDKADEWSKAVEDAAEALERAKNDSAKLALLGDNLEDYDKMRDALAGALRDANGNWMSLEEYIKAQGFLTSDDIKDFVTKAEFNDSLNVFRARIDEVSSKLEALTTEINTKLGLLQNSLNKYVSSVLIQGTDNPVFGSFAFPANISSNVLAAYYGDVKDLKFPTNEPYNYVDAQNALSAKDLEMMGVAAGNQFSYNGRVVSGMLPDGNVAAGNAGTLYVTVNPNTVDATGATAVLVNSQDSKSGVMLSPLAETDKVLNFG